jgi:hypothetical protein
MESSARSKIFTFDLNGNDSVVPIDNEGQGGAGSGYIYPIESFTSFTLSESGDEIYFVTYDQDSYNTQIVESSITKMTDQGYDKEKFVDLSSLLQRSDLWDHWNNERSAEITMMSEVNDNRVFLGVSYFSMYQDKAPEILEVNLLSGDYKVLTSGKLDYSNWMQASVDDYSTASVYYPDGVVEPPLVDVDSDGDGLPDEVEIAAGMNPYSSDKSVIDAVYNYYFTNGGGSTMTLGKSTPHTFNWYFQPEVGWMWTNHQVFPYIYKSSSDGEPSGWMFFSEQSANPIRMFDYNQQRWMNLGD